MIKWLKNKAGTLLLSITVAVESLLSRFTGSTVRREELVEPETLSDPYVDLMHRYCFGTEEEQAEAEDLITNPARKAEFDDIFMHRFKAPVVYGIQPEPAKGKRLGQVPLEVLQEQADRNYAINRAQRDKNVVLVVPDDILKQDSSNDT